MKLFIGMDLSEEALRYLTDAIKKLKIVAGNGRFMNPGLLHLTIEFLGEVDDERLTELENIINSISWEPFELEFLALGSFKRKEGAILWMGLRESIELSNLWVVLHDRLKESDFKVEDRPYIPHITLGRRVKLDGTAEEINKELSRPMPKFIADRLHLFHSTSKNGSLEYKKIFSKAAKDD